jgi:hypothetical protein
MLHAVAAGAAAGLPNPKKWGQICLFVIPIFLQSKRVRVKSG